MNLHALTLSLSEAELADLAALALASYVKNLHLSCREGEIVVEGDASYGSLSSPVTLTLKPDVTPDGEALVIEVVKAKAKMGPVAMSLPIGTILGMVPPYPGLRVEENALHLTPASLLAQRGIQLDMRLRKVTVQEGELRLEC